jgi:hydroxymethylpyrimidine pyrophosphatase-like HAD family hydrolase
MRFNAVALDYDGTLATDGKVDAPTLAALSRVREAGLKLLMVTGRELDDLHGTFDHVDMFDRIVAENGALLYRPQGKEATALAPPPPAAFVEALKARGVSRISVGSVIIATWEPHESVVLQTIRDFGLELEVIFNKGAVMVLPSGINKGTGLRAALRGLDISESATVGAGDAENDHSLLNLCGIFGAVANAIPSLKERADLVMSRDHGAGVVELIDQLLAGDLDTLVSKRTPGKATG